MEPRRSSETSTLLGLIEKVDILDIPANDLLIDYTYQRALFEPAIKKLMKDFAWGGNFGEAEVNVRDDNSIYVIDGQHRIEAARRLYGTTTMIPCRVYYGLSLDEERERYLARNFYSRPATKADTFRARLDSGEPDAVAVNDVLERSAYDLHIGMATASLPRGIVGSGTAEKVLRSWGKEILALSLEAGFRAWGREVHWHTELLKGLGQFYNQARKQDPFDANRLVQVLRLTTPEGLSLEGKRMMAVAGTTHGGGIALAIREAYNFKLGEQNRLGPLDTRRVHKQMMGERR
jgi:hypothetical protein